MRKLLVCAAALGLLAAVPAFAAPDDHHGDKRDSAASESKSHSESGSAHANAPARATTDTSRKNTGNTSPQGAMSGNHSPTGSNSSASGNGMHQNNSGLGWGSNSMSRSRTTVTPTPAAPRQGNSGWSNNTAGHQPAINTRQSNSGWSGNAMGSHSSINSLRLNVQAPRHFHNGDYRAPQGYQYHRWSYGSRLPRLYFARNYWILDFMSFSLFEPPSGLVWVRYGNDALLIDRESGDIVQVRYDVFY